MLFQPAAPLTVKCLWLVVFVQVRSMEFFVFTQLLEYFVQGCSLLVFQKEFRFSVLEEFCRQSFMVQKISLE